MVFRLTGKVDCVGSSTIHPDGLVVQDGNGNPVANANISDYQTGMDELKAKERGSKCRKAGEWGLLACH